MSKNDAGRDAHADNAEGLRARVINERDAPERLSPRERRRLVELVSLAIERQLKKHEAVDLSRGLSVDADAPEESNR